jgi:hypothetical protein
LIGPAAANVFIGRDATSGRYIGILGDIDDAVPVDGFVAGGADVKITPSYGAPHRHGDPSRDQVALLVTSAEFLCGVDWYACSCRMLRDAGLSERERRLWGYATDGSGYPVARKLWVAGDTGRTPQISALSN